MVISSSRSKFMKDKEYVSINQSLDDTETLQFLLSEDEPIAQLFYNDNDNINLYQTFLYIKELYIKEREKHIQHIVSELEACSLESHPSLFLFDDLNEALNIHSQPPLNKRNVQTLIQRLSEKKALSHDVILATVADWITSYYKPDFYFPNAWVVRGLTPLHFLSQIADIELMERVVNEGNPINENSTLDGNTALFNAIGGNKIEAFEWLIEHGANPAMLDKYKNSIFHALCALNRQDMLASLEKLLLRADEACAYLQQHCHLPLNYLDEILPFIQYTLFSKPQLDQLISHIKTLPDVTNKKDIMKCCFSWFQENNLSLHQENTHKQLPIFLLVHNDNVEVMKQLFNLPIDLNEKNSEGITPLMFASIWSKVNAMVILCENRAHTNLTCNWGQNALDYAIFCDVPKIVETLFMYSAEVSEKIGIALYHPKAKITWDQLQSIRNQVIKSHSKALGLKIISKCMLCGESKINPSQEEHQYYLRITPVLSKLINLLEYFFNLPNTCLISTLDIENCADYVSECLKKNQQECKWDFSLETLQKQINHTTLYPMLNEWFERMTNINQQKNIQTKTLHLRAGF